MKINILLATFILASSQVAHSQSSTDSYPTKPIKNIVGFAAGGPTDIVARSIAEYLGKNLGQAIVVENKPGANTIIAAELVANAPADGYTLLTAATNHTMIPALYGDRIKFDAVKSFTPLCTIASSPTVLVVGPSFKVATLQAFLDDVRRNPGKRSYATPGTGSGGHFATEVFAQMTDLKMNHIPYKGAAPAMNDLMAGQVDLSFATLASVLPLIKSGKLTPLAVASPSRSPFVPEVPTFQESGVNGYSADAWYGVLGPANLPKAVRSKIEELLIKNAQDTKTLERLSNLGLDAQSTCGKSFSDLIQSEVQANLTLAKRLNLKMD